jgi:carbamoyltransferase
MRAAHCRIDRGDVLALGLSGGLDLVFQHREYLFTPGICHDSAAVLAEDGRIVAAIEEERLNRIKHTSKGAVNAIRHCLRSRGIRLNDVDALIYYGSEEACTAWMRNLFYGSRDAQPVTTYRELIHELLRHGLGEELDDRKLRFVNHHLAHAISAYAQSGFSEGLVFTVDGVGDGLSGSITQWRGSSYELLATYSGEKSLGIFYDRVIAMIGYGFTEEYKVMGLAPYGDPARFRQAFEPLCSLLPRGDYSLNWHLLDTLYPLARVRKQGEPILQEHKDIAAALQEALERVVFHVLSYYRQLTGASFLCLAGGVAHNSTLNGKLLYSEMFRHIFVQPASNDSGCAIGAALYPFVSQTGPASAVTSPLPARIEHVFWGTDAGTPDEIGAALERWKPLIEVAHEAQVAKRSAALLADGQVLGWVQGRSEFGPRALGHRSIVADPRPAANKELINAMVKKREGYRPFAPAVLEEHAAEYFELPYDDLKLPFMSFTVEVRPQWRETLRGTTHVDNSARVQTVSKETDPRFWELIEEFRQLTGVAVLLNTSFNNDAEPIVDSVDDAVACFLTTGLQRLVVGEHLVGKTAHGRSGILDLCASLPAFARLTETKAPGHDGELVVTHAIANSYDHNAVAISEHAYRLLGRSSGGRQRVSALLDGDSEASLALIAELWTLWERRVVVMRPAGA